MTERKQIAQFDVVVDALLARRDGAPPSVAAEIVPLVNIAIDLRSLPREAFKSNLRAELERSISMSASAKPTAQPKYTATPRLSISCLLYTSVLRLKDQCVAIIVASIAGMPSREARVAQLEPVFSYRLLLQVERAGEETCHREERNQKHGAEEQHGLARKPGTHSVKSLFLRISHRG